MHQSRTKSFLANYRTGGGGRTAPNKRVVLGRHSDMSPERGRRMARRFLDEVAARELANGRAGAMPLLAEAFEDYMAANPNRVEDTDKNYRHLVRRYLDDWLARPLNSITRRDVEDRFNRITANHGWSQENPTLTLLRSVYRRPCVDLEGLHNQSTCGSPRAGGSIAWCGARYPPRPRCCRAGGRASRPRWQTLRPGMRSGSAFIPACGSTRCYRCAGSAWIAGRGSFWVEETKTGVPLELPVTRQLGAVLDRRWEDSGARPDGWVFPSATSASGRITNLVQYYSPIEDAGGAKFWYHGMRNCFITVAELELMLPSSLTKRLLNHAPPNDITESYAADWTIGQLRDPAQRIADRIEALMNATAAAAP